jgi:hypothetical protein
MNIYRIYFKWLTIIVLQSYGVTLYMYRTPYLVDIVRENVGKVLNLNSIEAGNAWKGMDILIFNSWHWWVHTGRSQGYFFPPFACPASTCAVVISSFCVCVCVCVFPHLSGTLALLLQRLAVQMQMGLHPGWISIVQKYGPIDGIQ